MERINVLPVGSWAKLGDMACYPMMRLLMELNGSPSESPIQTHRWNNRKLREQEVFCLKVDLMTDELNEPTARRLWSFMRHLPLLGWQKYVVIEPTCNKEIKWFPGWYAGKGSGISRVPQSGSVRLLLGPGPVRFYGVDMSGRQVSVRYVDEGWLGYGRHNACIPLI